MTTCIHSDSGNVDLQKQKFPTPSRSKSKFIHSNLGVMFLPIGSLLNSNLEQYLHLQIDLPDFQKIMDDFDLDELKQIVVACDLTKLADQHLSARQYMNETTMLCENYENLTDTLSKNVLAHKKDLSTKYENLRLYTDTRRDKRGIITAGLALIGGIIKGANFFVQMKRRRAVNEHLKLLDHQNQILQNRFATFGNQMITFAKITHNEIDTLKHNVSTLHKDIKHFKDILKIVLADHSKIQSSLRLLQLYTMNNRMFSMVNSRAIAVIHKLTEYFIYTQLVFDKMLSGLHQLELGRLPIDFVPKSDLRAALHYIQNRIAKDNPNYELLFQNERDIYLQNDVSFIVRDRTLIIQIPLYLKPRLNSPMTLHKIDTVFVPFLTDDKSQNSHHPSYTTVHFDIQYFAVNMDFFIPLTSEDLAQCAKYDKFYVCEQKLLHLHRSAKHCLSAIYWEKDIQEIIDTCEFRYYYNIHPPPKILDGNDEILISGLDPPWAIFCSENGYPEKIEGDSYGLISKETLCKCSIEGSQFHIMANELSCSSTGHHIGVKHPINVAVAYQLRNVFPNFHKYELTFDSKTVYSSDIPMPLPNLANLIDHPEDDVLADPTVILDQDLSRVIDVLSKDHKAYLTEIDKSQAKQRFHNWFKKENGVLGLIFIGCLCGIFGIIIILLIACYTTRLKLILGTMFTTVPTVEATPAKNPDYDLLFEEIFYSLLYHITYAIVVCIAYLLLKHLYHKFILFKWHIPVKGDDYCYHGKSNIYLELFTQSDKIQVYLGSIQPSPVNFKINLGIKLTSFRLSGKFFMKYAEMTWSENILAVNSPIPPTLFRPETPGLGSMVVDGSCEVDDPNSNADNPKDSVDSVVSEFPVFVLPVKVLLTPLAGYKMLKMTQNPIASRLLLCNGVYYPISDIQIGATPPDWINNP